MSVIYFIQAGQRGPVKIGTATDPRRRLAELQTGCPDELRLLATLWGGRREEQQLHDRFWGYRVRGEWFAADPVVMALRRGALGTEVRPEALLAACMVCGATVDSIHILPWVHRASTVRFGCAREECRAHDPGGYWFRMERWWTGPDDWHRPGAKYTMRTHVAGKVNGTHAVELVDRALREGADVVGRPPASSESGPLFRVRTAAEILRSGAAAGAT